MNAAEAVLRVLLVEDDPAAVVVCQEALTGLTEPLFEVTVEATLRAALSCLGERSFDVVLLDLGLADSSGLTTFERLHEAHPQVPVLVLTGHGDEGVGLQALQAGAQDYLFKHELQPLLLGRSLRYAIERHRVAAELDRRTNELAASEERFELALSGSAAGLWDWNLRTNKVFFSDRFKALLGYDPLEFPNEVGAYVDCIHREDRPRVRAAHTAHLTERAPFDVEFRVYTRSGSVRWVQCRAQALWDEQGSPYRMVGWVMDVTARRQADESLRLFRDLVDRSNDAIEVIDPATGRFLDVNERDVLDLGYTREELLQMRVWEIEMGIDPKKWPEMVARTQVDKTFRGEGVHRRKDGSLFSVEFTVRWVELNRSYLVVVVRDITERKRTEERLKLHEMVQEEMGRIAKVGGWSFDPRSGEGYWTHEVARIHDLDPSAQVSKELAVQFFQGEHRQRIEQALQEAIECGKPYDLELELVTAQGAHKWVRTIGHPVVEEGKVVQVRGSFQDISEQRAALHRIQRQADLLDKASDAIILRTLDEKMQFWSKGAERIYGWPAEEVVGRTMMDKLFDDPEQITQPLEILHRDGEWKGELRQRRRDGSEILVHARWTLLYDSRGQPEAVLSINTDVTAQRQLEARFLRAQRLESIGTLAGGIAHDINNVLSPILMSLSLLKIQHTDEETLSLLDTLERSAKRGRDLVRQVLSFSRGMQGTHQHVQPSAIGDEINKIVRNTFPPSIQFQHECEDDIWVVRGDPTQLHQVLMNLCVNARDAMPKGGCLGLQLRNIVLDETAAEMHPEAKAGPYVMIVVSDEGGGIPEALRDRIFEPFFTTKDQGHGTGLGLATVLGIVKAHHGFINLYSELGQGTTFRIYLPAAEGDFTLPVPELSVEGQHSRGRGEVILVVDDERAIRSVAQRTLEKFGYQVLTAAHGAEGVSVYTRQQNQIAAVISDLAMPVMDGPSMIHALKAIDPGVKILGTTGLATAASEAKLRDLGVTHFLPKPYVAESLLHTLRDLLDAPLSSGDDSTRNGQG